MLVFRENFRVDNPALNGHSEQSKGNADAFSCSLLAPSIKGS